MKNVVVKSSQVYLVISVQNSVESVMYTRNAIMSNSYLCVSTQMFLFIHRSTKSISCIFVYT